MRNTLILFSLSLFLSPLSSQVYPALHIDGEAVVGQPFSDLLGTRLTISDASSFSGINLGESDSDRGFILWENDGDLLKLGTRHSATTYDYILALKDGKLGIGTNAPTELLDINGNALVRSDLTTNGASNLMGILNIGPGTGSNELNLFDIGGNNDVVLRIQTAGAATEMVMGLNSTGGLFGTVTATDLRFRTSNTHRMSITPDGDVGINTTGPTAKFDVNGTTRLRSTLTTEGTSNLEGRINLGPGTGTNELNIFDIGGNGDAVIRAQTTGGAKEVLWGVSSLGGIMGTVTSDNLTLRTNNSTKMTITPGGDVGIGTSNPGDKLEVVGDAMLDRGSNSSGLTRTMRIQGARNGSGSDIARLDFRNIDDNSANSEYVAARLSVYNEQSSDGGALEIWSQSGGTLEKQLEFTQISGVKVHGALNFQSGILSNGFWPNDDAQQDLGKNGNRWQDVWAFKSLHSNLRYPRENCN
ncbi:MAG: hypothetical protein OEM26_13655 [Saprospiraceae bacterium]|nr:hypothetical protein [Saprospiraceae bacterium]